MFISKFKLSKRLMFVAQLFSLSYFLLAKKMQNKAVSLLIRFQALSSRFFKLSLLGDKKFKERQKNACCLQTMNLIF